LGPCTAQVLEALRQHHTPKAARTYLNLTEEGLRHHTDKLKTFGILVGDVRTSDIHPHNDPPPVCSGKDHDHSACRAWLDRASAKTLAGTDRVRVPSTKPGVVPGVVAHKPGVGGDKTRGAGAALCRMVLAAKNRTWSQSNHNLSCEGAQAVSSPYGESDRGESEGRSPSAPKNVTDSSKTKNGRTTRQSPRQDPNAHPGTGYPSVITNAHRRALKNSVFAYPLSLDPASNRCYSRLSEILGDEDQVGFAVLCFSVSELNRMMDETDLRARSKPDGYLATVITNTPPDRTHYRHIHRLVDAQWTITDDLLRIVCNDVVDDAA
jgi:hypothetical protein